MLSSNSNVGISVFFPAFNDAGSIVPLVMDALAVLQTLTDDYEVIVVNDGSTDATPALLDDVARRLEHVKIIHHERNSGYGAALRTGFSHASKELVFYTDGDGQYDVRCLADLLPLMAVGTDVVNGYKIKRADKSHRVLIGSLYNRLARSFFRLPIRDVDCDFRLVRRSAIQRIELISSSGVICVELVRKLHASGCAFAEVAVPHYPRVHGQSQFFTPRRVARTAVDFFALWIRLVLLRPFNAKAGGRREISSPAPAREEAAASFEVGSQRTKS